MASLLDLYTSSGPPQSWNQADINLMQDADTNQAGIQSQRLERNFTQYDLPDLMNSQAARGAFYSGATQDKANRLQTAENEATGDIATGLQFKLSDLANKTVGNAAGVNF